MYEAQNAFSPPVQFLQKAGGGAGLLVKHTFNYTTVFSVGFNIAPLAD